MKLCGIELFSGVPQKIINKGNQFVRTKTLVTRAGNITAALENDTITIIGSNGQKARITGFHPIGETNMTNKEAAEHFFRHFENIFDPQNDAISAVLKALR